MIPKALQAYTFIQYLWDSSRDVVELYVPMVVRQILDENLYEIDEEKLKEYFSGRFGLDNITYGGLRAILKRMRSKGLLYGSTLPYKINIDKVRRFAENSPSEPDISEQMSVIKKEICQFAKNEYGLDLSENQIEQGLLVFFHKNEGELYFDQGKFDTSQKISAKSTLNQKIRYVISKYILKAKEANSPIFDVLLKFAKGHMLVSLVSLQDFSSYTGKLDDLHVYIDSPILYHLLKISDEGSFRLSTEMVERLHTLNAKLRIRDLHYNEFINSLKTAIKFLDSKIPDMNSANKAARFAIENNLSSSDLSLKLQQIDSILKRYGIVVVPEQKAPARFTDISSIDLYSKICAIYTCDGQYSLPAHKQEAVRRDVSTIVDIFRLRGNDAHTSLKTCKAILITLNRGITRAAKETGNEQVVTPIPPCLTNEILSAVLWANYPEKSSNINEELLVYECYRNIELKDSILNNFYRDIKEKYNAHAITEEQYLAATSSRLVIQMLKEETFNSEDLYTDDTAVEIAERIRQKEEKRASRAEETNNTIKENCWISSMATAKHIVNVVWIILVICALGIRFGTFGNSTLLNVIGFIPAVLICLWGLLSWNKFIPDKQTTIKTIGKKLFERKWAKLTKRNEE